MLDLSSNYEFQTYGVGIIIKPSIVDRDDFIRSKYKLKGIDSIKTDIAKELIKLFTKKTQKTLDSFDPEITFTVNLKDESCQLHSKSITIFGKYINVFDDKDLSDLYELLSIEDEIIYKWYFKKENNLIITNNKITKMLKEYKF